MRRLALAIASGKVIGWDYARSRRIWKSIKQPRLHYLAFSPDGSLMVTVSTDSRGTIWNASTGVKVTELENPKVRFNVVAFAPDSKHLFGYHESNSKGVACWAADGKLTNQIVDGIISFD